LKLAAKMFRFRRWLSSALATGKPISVRAKLLFALLIFILSYSTKCLHAVDLAPLVYTTREPLGALADAYDIRATSILNGEGLLGPYSQDPRDTSSLARAPGYPIYLSVIYSVFGRDYFKVQLVQNALNSISPVLIFLIAGLLLGWRIAVASGMLAALSHHLSYMSNWILPDSLAPVLLLTACYFLLIARRFQNYSYWLYGLAGALIGLSAWLRSNTLLLGPFLLIMLVIIAARRRPTAGRAALMALVSFLVIAPITIKNYLRHGEFVPINIQLGLVMWEGIAVASGDRFGAVLDDNEVARQEAVIYNNPSYGAHWSSPDGIQRDRDRVKKSLAIIAKHPIWYSGVMLDRCGEMLKYSAHAPLVSRDGEQERFEESDITRPRWRSVTRDNTILEVGKKLSWLRLPTRALQRITKEAMLAFIVLGTAIILAASWRRGLFLLTVPLYHLLFQSLMNTEFRYGLPIHYFLFVFAGTIWVLIFSLLWKGLTKLRKKI
jgi:4-amino-4-deoxy-L-arabinose transferase-like glycosyltransferase